MTKRKYSSELWKILSIVLSLSLILTMLMLPGCSRDKKGKSETKEKDEERRITISISQEGAITVNGKPMEIAGIQELFSRSEEQRKKVTIKADKGDNPPPPKPAPCKPMPIIIRPTIPVPEEPSLESVTPIPVPRVQTPTQPQTGAEGDVKKSEGEQASPQSA